MIPTWPAYHLTRYDTYEERVLAGLDRVMVPEGMVLSFVVARVHRDRSELVKMAIPHAPDLPDNYIHGVIVSEYESLFMDAHPNGPPV